ncbi:uncharacterized protein F5891DRAFT_24571 [Suillus fuscotomentosus]|uniref:WD40 repeat-like protein n=1 Tax=Suillus fuscotomentosus TaxID=1912939 RepID=A0AAD4EM93_9AGAM|nr:uncharacterized protein F5891DRAFT_24571 [Suillus fuscotomentosus]KAG1908705.1 hypothetical protein F5891DRAFT_24571 [Suillus fuscotomentosus]
MWADQISASEDPKAPVGYDVDDDAPVVDVPESETRSTAVEEHAAVDSPQVVPASLQAKPSAQISFPISEDLPQTFPTTVSMSDSPSTHSHPERSAIPAHVHANVTFDAKATTPPRASSPEPKRALSTHNIQRLARKISLSGKAPKLPGVLRRWELSRRSWMFQWRRLHWLRMWDLRTGALLKMMAGHKSEVCALAVSRDGQLIASGDEKGEVIAWHGATGVFITQAIKAKSGIISLDFSESSASISVKYMQQAVRLVAVGAEHVH